jgi:Flp pilus assembly protein CpaB
VENIMSSKLFTTRQGTVLLGVIAAAIAAIALVVYLNNYRNSHKSGSVISVLVAQKLIQSGTTGDVIRTNAGYYKPTNYSKSQVESGAIIDPATLANKVALTDISPGQQLTAADFGPATGLATELNANQRAVVVSLGSPNQVGGQIAAGSHVDVWAVVNGQTNGVTRSTVELMYQDMYVLGLSGDNVTLRATPTQAGQLIYTSANAQIWLTLRPTVGTTPKAPVITGIKLGGH